MPPTGACCLLLQVLSWVSFMIRRFVLTLDGLDNIHAGLQLVSGVRAVQGLVDGALMLLSVGIDNLGRAVGLWSELLKNLDWSKLGWAQGLIQLDKLSLLDNIIRIASSLVFDGAVDTVTKDVAVGILGHRSGNLESGSGDGLSVTRDLFWLNILMSNWSGHTTVKRLDTTHTLKETLVKLNLVTKHDWVGLASESGSAFSSGWGITVNIGSGSFANGNIEVINIASGLGFLHEILASSGGSGAILGLRGDNAVWWSNWRHHSGCKTVTG